MIETTLQPVATALMIRSCDNCATLLAPDTLTCPDCGCTDLTAVPSCGAGSIVSCTVVHCTTRHGIHPGFVECTIAIVELDDGPWTYAWLEGGPPEHSSDRVRVRFAHEEPGERFPYFVRAA
ncbi:Zn-ribbon domain-containing OB-fold protein [Rhodococcus sp. NPDC058505]|uniref:Zn-ribbon domain-containing OB-fold protein n=1 Tax=unclassified Rhodococcus (in: high G+C Gram-positive bacteria) TaxID=192944 RepID=UPI00365F12F3